MLVLGNAFVPHPEQRLPEGHALLLQGLLSSYPGLPAREPKIPFRDSHTHFPAMHKRLSHPSGQIPLQGCTTSLVPAPTHPSCRQAGAVPSPGAHFNTTETRGSICSCWGLCPTPFSRTHHYTPRCPSCSHSDASSPTTQTTDLIFIFLNTQGSSPSAANPSEPGRETE